MQLHVHVCMHAIYVIADVQVNKLCVDLIPLQQIAILIIFSNDYNNCMGCHSGQNYAIEALVNLAMKLSYI